MGMATTRSGEEGFGSGRREAVGEESRAGERSGLKHRIGAGKLELGEGASARVAGKRLEREGLGRAEQQKGDEEAKLGHGKVELTDRTEEELASWREEMLSGELELRGKQKRRPKEGEDGSSSWRRPSARLRESTQEGGKSRAKEREEFGMRGDMASAGFHAR